MRNLVRRSIIDSLSGDVGTSADDPFVSLGGPGQGWEDEEPGGVTGGLTDSWLDPPPLATASNAPRYSSDVGVLARLRPDPHQPDPTDYSTPPEAPTPGEPSGDGSDEPPPGSDASATGSPDHSTTVPPYSGGDEGRYGSTAPTMSLTGGGKDGGGDGGGDDAYSGPFAGWNMEREQSAAGKIKYDMLPVLRKYDPLRVHTDRAYAEQLLAELNALHPGEYQLNQDNDIILVGEGGEGYVGGRPLDWMGNGAWDESGNQTWQWQWHGFNASHPNPSAGGGGGGTPSTTTSSTNRASPYGGYSPATQGQLAETMKYIKTLKPDQIGTDDEGLTNPLIHDMLMQLLQDRGLPKARTDKTGIVGRVREAW